MFIKRIIAFIYYKLKSGHKVKFSFSTIIGKNTRFEGCNKIYDNSFFKGFIGYGSYMGYNAFICASIGRFTSIASNCRTIIGVHPYTYPFVSTSPMFFSTLKQNGGTFVEKAFFQEHRYADTKNQIPVVIGNDCWINENVQIVSGVKISDGAVILAGAVVTKDVPPYAIVGGVPAKIIKYRYSEEDIKFLLNFKWWEKDFEWIKNNAHLFSDIEKFKINSNS